jgi:hypothetical protein
MAVAGLEISKRQEGDSDLSKPQADYLQGFLVVNGFDRLDEGVLAALSQEQASELLDQVDTICEGGFD